MNTEMIIPKTLQEAILQYSDTNNCLEILTIMRWGADEVSCPYCDAIPCAFLKNARRWACKSCRKQFSIKVGTIMEDSAIGLDKWLTAIWLIANAKNGISSCELARSIGVTQKSAWFLLHRIRFAMDNGGIFQKMSGPVEADETVIGGLEKNKHKHKRLSKGPGGDHSKGKTIVMGVLERGEESRKSTVRAEIIENCDRKTLEREIKETVEEFATLYTDAYTGYKGLSDEYIHEFVDHTVMYAIGQIHTNGIENFWSLLKRGLKGTYVSVEPFHLKAYIDEQVFRFNNRGMDDTGRFLVAASKMTGKRLTYDELTSRYEAYFNQIFP